MTDSKRKRMPAEPNVKSRLMMRAARMTMQMFTRLLTTRIVASSRSTFASSRSMAAADALLRLCK